MAFHDQNGAAYSSTTKETLTPSPSSPSSTKPLPALPFDLIEQILCRLPVKFLLHFRCVCKSWNSLISDSIFAKKYLRLSTSFSLQSLRYSKSLGKYILMSFPLDSMSPIVTELEFPVNSFDGKHHQPYAHRYVVGSCNGMIYLAHFWDSCFVSVWNPSIRKFKELPPFEKPQGVSDHISMTHGFGYDRVNDNYKAVVVLKYCVAAGLMSKTEVKVHIFGTNFWKSIQEFPFGGVPCDISGEYVSGAINWLAYKQDQESKRASFIVSFDLGNESYKKILLPDYGDVDVSYSVLGVLRDCLCMIFGHDVWVMKEYGNIESWTILFNVSFTQDPGKSYTLFKAIYMFEDDQVLLECIWPGDRYRKLIVYDPRNGTFKFINFRNKTIHALQVCVESLTSP